MKRIACLCADPGVPYGGTKGASVHFGEMTRALADEGSEVLALAAHVAPDASPSAGVVVEQLPGPGKGSPAAERLEADATRTEWLVRRLRHHGAEMLYERLALHTALGSLAARDLGIPHVVEVNAPLLEESRRFRRLDEPEQAAVLEQATLRSADLVLAVSRPLAHYATQRGASRVRVMPNAVAAERFPAPSRDGGEEPVAVLAGNLRLWHGVETVAEAWRILGPAAPALLVIGDGQGRDLLEAVGAEVTGPMPSSAVPAAMSRGQIGLAPYGADSPRYFSPLKLFEYLAAGLAVVAADLPGVTDIVGPESAMLVPAGDAGAFAQAVERLASDESLRERMGAAGRELVTARHTWRHRAREVLLAAAELPRPGAVTPA